MSTTTIAAGEIREYEVHDRKGVYKEVEFHPFDADRDTSPPVCVVFPPNWASSVRVMVDNVLTPAEARDFARAILAAADWAERQGG